MPDVNKVVKLAIPAAVALLGARLANQVSPYKDGALGFAIEVAGAVVGALLAAKLNVG